MQFPVRLMEGYRSFRENRFPAENHRLRLLAETGQQPAIMLVGCCDSRAAPEVIFDAAPGEIFVVRNIANLIPPYEPDGHYHGTSSAIEFAVKILKVQHIVVMGHENCGGIQAVLQEIPAPTPYDFIAHWMSLADEGAAAVRADATIPAEAKARELEHRGILLSLRNLMTFPWVRTAVAAGELQLHGAWFDIANGTLHVLDDETEKFVTI